MSNNFTSHFSADDAALVLIDFQPQMFMGVESHDRNKGIHLSKTRSRHSASLGSSERLIRIIRDYPTLTLPLTSSQTRKECSAEHDAGDECHHPLHEAASPFPTPAS